MFYSRCAPSKNFDLNIFKSVTQMTRKQSCHEDTLYFTSVDCIWRVCSTGKIKVIWKGGAIRNESIHCLEDFFFSYSGYQARLMALVTVLQQVLFQSMRTAYSCNIYPSKRFHRSYSRQRLHSGAKRILFHRQRIHLQDEPIIKRINTAYERSGISFSLQHFLIHHCITTQCSDPRCSS